MDEQIEPGDDTDDLMKNPTFASDEDKKEHIEHDDNNESTESTTSISPNTTVAVPSAIVCEAEINCSEEELDIDDKAILSLSEAKNSHHDNRLM